MSATKIVRTRTAGWCSAEFAHPSRIEAGDTVRVTTYFASDEECRSFGVVPLSRFRRCSWCVAQERASKQTVEGCDRCGADVYHGEPHYGDCKLSDSESDRG